MSMLQIITYEPNCATAVFHRQWLHRRTAQFLCNSWGSCLLTGLVFWCCSRPSCSLKSEPMEFLEQVFRVDVLPVMPPPDITCNLSSSFKCHVMIMINHSITFYHWSCHLSISLTSDGIQLVKNRLINWTNQTNFKIKGIWTKAITSN